MRVLKARRRVRRARCGSGGHLRLREMRQSIADATMIDSRLAGTMSRSTTSSCVGQIEITFPVRLFPLLVQVPSESESQILTLYVSDQMRVAPSENLSPSENGSQHCAAIVC